MLKEDLKKNLLLQEMGDIVCVEEGGVPKDPTGFHSHSGGLVSFKALHQVRSYGQNNYPPLSHVHDPKSFSGSLHLQTLSVTKR